MQLSALTSELGRFVSELQRRKVIRVASAYVVGAWIVLQVAVALQAAMSLSASFSAAILALLVIGFPMSLVLTWFFEITPEGIKRTLPANGDGALVKPQTTDLILAGALGLVVIVALAQLLIPTPTAPPSTTPATTTAEAPPAKLEPPAPGDKSIAVLPFANLSPDKDDAYFADGLTEEILNILAQLRGVKVTSRTSSLAFKGKAVGLQEIAKQLGVRHILEGSVRRDGDDIRITAQLIDAATDAHVWSKTFERKFAEIFAVQDEIARTIAAALNTELSVSAGSRAAPTANMEAYRLHLQAQERTLVFAKQNTLDAIDLERRAIELDPGFAAAHAHLAGLYGGLSSLDPTRKSELTAKARETAQTAIGLNPRLAAPYAVLGFLDLDQLRWAAAVENASKAIEFDPSDVDALAALGHAQLALGFVEKAARTLRELAAVDPLGGQAIWYRSVMVALAQGDMVAAAEPAAKLQFEKGPGSAARLGNWVLALAARDKKDNKEAVRHFRLSLEAQNEAVSGPVVRALENAAARAAAVKALQDEAARDPTFEPGTYYLLVGAADAFFDALNDRTTPREDAWGFSLPLSWYLAARGEGANPKLKTFLRSAGLVDYWKKHGWPDRCRAKGEDDFECG